MYLRTKSMNTFTLCFRARRTLKQFGLVILASSAIACSIDQQGFGVAADPANLLQDVETEYHSYNLSQVKPYDTVTIHTRGISGTGAMIEAPITYGYNPRYITVDTNGQIAAVSPVSSTPVTVTMAFGGATRADTVMVSVISGAPKQLRRLAIEPNIGDSAKVSAGGLSVSLAKSLRLIREDVDGINMSTMLVSLRSSDLVTAKIVQSGNTAKVTGVRPGQAMLHVSTYAYGVGMRDSLSFLVGWPLGGTVSSYSRYDPERKGQVIDFNGGSFTIGVGSCILWWNLSETQDLDIVFEDSLNLVAADSAASEILTLCKTWATADTMSNGTHAGGNITPWRKKLLPNGDMDFFSRVRVRVFRKPGVYRYRSPLNGTAGVITVCDEKNDRTCAPENYQWGVVDP